MIPLSDHRPAQTPVRDQGGRGACVGFAVAAAHEWMRPTDSRSVEDVLWAAHLIGGDPKVEGTLVEFALRGIEQHGHALESAWPFGAPPFPADRPIAARDACNRAALTSWRRLPTVDTATLATEVARGAAVVVTLAIVANAWPPGGIVDAPAGRKALRNHAVLAVGTSELEDEPHTVIKNSWGPGWGVNGYGFITPRYLAIYARAGHSLEPAA